MKRLLALALALSLSLSLATGAYASAPHGDPLLPRQWGLAQVSAQQAWHSATGKGVVVAVIDMGVDGTHPDLRGRVLPGIDLFDPTQKTGWHDIDGHGTEVAGVVAATRGNGLGIAGVAPDATILPVRVGDVSPNGNLTARAVRWAVAHAAKVIVMSIGTLPVLDAVSPAFNQLGFEDQAAIDEAWAKGVTVIVAAGNNAEPICSDPASLKHVVCVGAVDKRRLKSGYSSFDAAMSQDYLVAPGGSDDPYASDAPVAAANDELVWTTTVPGTGTQVTHDYWGQEHGTSFAAPFVGGIAALLVQRGLSNTAIVKRLESTATDLGAPGRDPVFGYGEVNAAAAVR